jgi:ABC-type branched-subunit amino acid transport system permease subunit
MIRRSSSGARDWPMDATTRGILIAFGALALLSPFVPVWAIFHVTIVLGKAMVVLGLLILWRTGLMSFGQALYYGIGGYAVGLAQLNLGLHDVFLLVALGILAAAVIAVVLGLLVTQYREIFFAMLSLAFSMMLYGTLVKSETLGSTDGFAVAEPRFAGFAPSAAEAKYGLCLLAIAVAALGAWVVHRYLASTMGHLTTAIRDNEIRVEYLGYPVRRAILVKYVLAAALSGAGGALVALAVGHIDPEMAYWTTSGEFVFVTILSGAGSVLAPFVGSALFEVLRTYATDYAPYSWQMVLGICLLALILFLPDGVWSLFRRRRRAVRAVPP